MQDSAMSDDRLLDQYVNEQSEAAFAELVGRHVNMVYSAALRITNDGQAARDVSQEVFLKLAYQARSLRHGAALPAWLYRVAHARAVNAVRAEARRKSREQQAVRMKELESEEDVWSTLTPWVDEALASLDRKEQAAVVLRFFAGKKLADVGEALGLTEEAGRKRVARALEKLRGFFRRRGVEVSSAALASVLGAQAVQAAPAGLAATLTEASLAGAAGATSWGSLWTLTQTLLMTKTGGAIIVLIAVGVVVTPLALKKAPKPPTPPPVAGSAAPELTPAPPPVSPAEAGVRAVGPAERPGRYLMERVAALPKLTPEQIADYVAKNKGNAESLLAAWRASGDTAWLAEAAKLFPNSPDVQYAVIASQAFPEAQREWIGAYQKSSPANALGWYFSAQEYLKGGDKARAVEELAAASTKPEYRAQFAATLQALEELNLAGGRSADEAKIAAFQTCAQSPELPGLRELAKGMRDLAQQYRQQGDQASADSLAGMGLVLGAHLGEGYGSQTVINQLVGMAIQKTFLQQLDPAATQDPFGRSVADLTASINQRTATLKEHANTMQALLTRLEDSEWSIYMERVKLYGEEAALAWLRERHGD